MLFVGRLIGVKRCDLLLEAIARMKDRGRRTVCWIAGDGAEREGLERLARSKGLQEVRFLGNVPTGDLPALYGGADLFVLPSDHEPFGAVVCEAMACGLPVVLSDRVGSAPDLVVGGENGEVFPAGDSSALAAALERLLADPAGLRTMGDRSVQRVSRWTPQAGVENILSAIQVADRSGGRG